MADGITTTTTAYLQLRRLYDTHIFLSESIETATHHRLLLIESDGQFFSSSVLIALWWIWVEFFWLRVLKLGKGRGRGVDMELLFRMSEGYAYHNCVSKGYPWQTVDVYE